MKPPLESPIHLSVSIVLYNSSMELLQRTLQSLQRSAEVARAAACFGSVSVDVVDNSSEAALRRHASEALAAWAKDDFFRVSYTALPENRGFGAGHNSVIPRQDSDYHLILNPDALLAEDALRV